MRVLLTGHQGYIGSLLTPRLQQAGHDVVGLDSGWFDECLLPPFAKPEVEGITLDYRDIEKKHLVGFEAVLHLAGLSNDPMGNLDGTLTHDINTLGTLRMARLAKEAGVRRFIFSSSCSTYGAAGDDFLDEQAAFNPVTPYGRSKVDVEHGLSKLADDHFSPVYLRNATAYGVTPRLRLDLVLNNLVVWALTTGRVLLLSDGTPWRPIVHVEDICSAFLAALEAPREAIHDQAFNVGRTDENYRISELAEIVAEAVPGAQVEIAEGAGPDLRCYRVNCDKIATALPGFEARWDARRGAAELVEACRRAELQRSDLDNPHYIRLKRFQELLARGELRSDLRQSHFQEA